MGPSQISDTPFQGYCHYYFSNIHISNTHPNRTLISVNTIYINNVAVSCKRYPQVYHISLLYKRVVKKNVDVLSVNLGFSRLLIW